VLTQLRNRSVRVVTVDTAKASPFAQSLLFNWIGAYMYEGDAPLAERRAAALALDRDLLRDLLGAEELRELLDPGALADVELELQLLADGRRARSADELHDVLRRLGDLSPDELDLRCEGSDGAAWVQQLEHDRRAISVSVAGATRFIAAEDAARYRDALGCNVPLGLPRAFTEPVPHPLESLLGRFARTHGPFVTEQVAARFGISADRAHGALVALEGEGRVVRGEFRPRESGGTSGSEWCDAEVLRQIRRRSLAVLRREVEPVEPEAYSRFVQAWHGVGSDRRTFEGLVEVLGQLQGAALVASSLEAELLPSRLRTFRPTDLDELCTSGDLVWVGAGAIGASDGRVRLCFADQLPMLAPGWEPLTPPEGALHDAIRVHLAQRGASFWNGLRAASTDTTDTELLAALWDLVWAGEVTNDSLAPLRTMLSSKGLGSKKPAASPALRQRPRPGRLNRIGPPMGAGRWSLVAPLLEPVPTGTQAVHATALQLLERYGVVTREAVLAENVVGGYASVYGVLKVLEERGTVRRGYFVAGLGAAQFGLPGAVDRLRSARETVDAELHPHDVPAPVVLAATDPAQPFGAAIAWPASTGRPARAAGASVVLRAGVPLAWFDRRSYSVVTFPAADTDANTDGGWAGAMFALVKDGRVRSLEVRKVNGEAVSPTSPAAALLKAAGFVEGYRGWVARA
jgi:ATP-dependent Lhr-like helicase